MNMNRRGVVSAVSLHLRKTPNGDIIGHINKGDPVHVTEAKRTATVDWYRVKPLNKSAGWVAARYVKLDPPDVEPIAPIPPELEANVWLYVKIAAALVAAAALYWLVS